MADLTPKGPYAQLAPEGGRNTMTMVIMMMMMMMMMIMMIMMMKMMIIMSFLHPKGPQTGLQLNLSTGLNLNQELLVAMGQTIITLLM